MMNFSEFISKNKILYVALFFINTIFMSLFLTLSSVNNIDFYDANAISISLIKEDEAILFNDGYYGINAGTFAKSEFPNDYVYFADFIGDGLYICPNDDFQGIKLTKECYGSTLEGSTFNLDFLRFDKYFNFDLPVNESLSNKAHNEVSLKYLNNLIKSGTGSTNINDISEILVYFDVGVFMNKDNEDKLKTFINEYRNNSTIYFKDEFNELNLSYYGMLGQTISVIFLFGSAVIDVFFIYFFYVNNKKDFIGLYIIGKRGFSLYKDYIFSYLSNIVISFGISFLIFFIFRYITYIPELEFFYLKINVVSLILVFVYIIFSLIVMSLMPLFNRKKYISYRIKDLS